MIQHVFCDLSNDFRSTLVYWSR